MVVPRTARAEEGSASLELVILAPVIFAILACVIAAGRTSIAAAAVAAAARDAARQASIAATPGAARATALASARAALRQDGLDCSPEVIVSTGGFSVPVGMPSSVSASVTCTVSLSDLLVPGMPGARTLQASFTSPLDPYRER
jgi:TadE-like protein